MEQAVCQGLPWKRAQTRGLCSAMRAGIARDHPFANLLHIGSTIHGPKGLFLRKAHDLPLLLSTREM